MALKVVRLDTLEICSVFESRCIGTLEVKILHPSFNVWISSSDGIDVALEVRHVYGIKTDNCSK